VDEGRIVVGANPEGGRRSVPTLAGLAVAPLHLLENA
jgi:hypothetical protein